MLLWWFFTSKNYLPLIILAVVLLLYFFSIARRVFAFLLALLLLLLLLVQTDFVQNIIISKVTSSLSKSLKTTVSIKHVSFSFFNKMNLESTIVRDLNKDTLFYAGAVKVRITDWFFWKSNADLKYIGIEDAIIKQQRKDSVWNYQFIVDHFASSDTTTSKDTSKGIAFNFKKIDLKNVSYTKTDDWDGNKTMIKVGSMLLDADTIDIGRSLFLINSIDLDKPYFSIENFDGKGPVDTSHPALPDTGMYFNPGGIVAKVKSIKITNGFFANMKRGRIEEKGIFDGSNIQAGKLNGVINDLSFIKDTIKAAINLSAKDRSGFELKKLQADFKLTPAIMEFKKFDLETPKSHITDYYAMRYKDFNKDMGEYVDKIIMDARFRNATVSSDDIAYFAPELSSWKTSAVISGKYYGTVTNFNVKDLFLKAGSNSYVSGNLTIKGLPDIRKTSISLTNAGLQTINSDLTIIYPPIKKITSPNLAALGLLRFTGTVGGTLTSYDINGNFSTAIGGVYTRLTLSFPKGGEPVYKGNVQTKQFNLGKFVNSDLLGNIGFNGDVDGYSFSLDTIKASINGNFSNLEFNNYNYKNLTFNGALQKQKFNGDFNAADTNFEVTSHIEIDLSDKEPAFNILGDVATAKLKKLNFTKDNFQLTGLFDFNFKGHNIDQFLGSAKLFNATLLHDSTYLDFDSLSVTAFNDSVKGRILTATSNQFNVSIEGKKYSILELPKSFQAFLSRYYPSYIDPPREEIKDQQFSVTINTHDFDKYAKLLDSSLSGLSDVHIEGNINSYDTSFSLLAKIPYVRYKKYRLEDADIKGAGDYSNLVLTGTLNRVYLGDSFYLPGSTFHIKSANDHSSVKITTSANTTLKDAHLNAEVYTLPDGVKIDFDQSSFAVNDKVWNLEKEGEIIIKQDFASATNVKFVQGFQEISVESENKDSSNLIIKLKNVNLGDFTPLITQTPRLEGIANGNIFLRDFYNKFRVEAALKTEQFRMDDDSIGVVNIAGKYNSDNGRADFSAKSNNENYVFDITGHYNTKDSANNPLFTTGHFTTIKTNILNRFLGDLFGNITGYANGDLTVSGDPSSPQILGHMLLRKAGLTVKFTQVRYTVDSANIYFKDNGIDLGEFTIHDKNKNTGTVKGFLYEKGFKNMRFDFDMATKKMLLLDTKQKDNQQFYGRAVGRATLALKGPLEDMQMYIAGEVNDTTHIFINTSNNRGSTEVDFIRFKQYGKEIKPIQTATSKLNIDLDLTANNQAQIDVILDEITGDVIKATGNGRLLINVPATGNLSMKGRYNIEGGRYDFNFQSLIKKPFDLLPDAGSFIEWTGDPYNANIHIAAQYTASNVSLGELVNGQAQLSGTVQAYRGDVYVIATLTDKLTKPDIKFSLAFQQNSAINNDPTFQIFLEKLQGNDNEMLKQVTWLIVFGSFAPYGQGLGSTNDNLVRSAGINTISQKISDEVNNMVNSAFSKIGLQFNVSASTYSSSTIYGSTATGNRLDRQSIDFKFNKSLLNGRLVVTVGSGFDFNISNASAIQSNNFQWLPDISMQILLARNPVKGTQLKAIVFNKSSLDVNSSSGGIGRRIRQGISISYSFDISRDKPTADKKDVSGVPPPKGK